MSRNLLKLAALIALCGAVAACNDKKPAETSEEFAARIGTGPQESGDRQTAEPGQVAPPGEPTAPQIATPVPGAAPGPLEPGTATDPKAVSCGAPAAAEFIGQQIGPAERKAIAALAPSGSTVRILGPGSGDLVGSDPSRLNVMVDAYDVARDMRCG